MVSACLDEATVVAFLSGNVSNDGLAEVQAHVSACGACAELVTWAAAELTNHSRAPGAEGRPFVGQLGPGARVDRYQILGAVGRGGMGEVYAAYHPDLDRRIALKVVHEAGADTAQRRARLLREARTIARVSHPNIITVHDAGTFGERVYIAMEFVEGETVEVWLRAQPRSWREIVEVFVAAGRGLAAAHAAGVVHRDFKPQNVMIGRDGAVRVMDFGLARLADEPIDERSTRRPADQPLLTTTVTKTGALVGTLAYMAPEQFRGEALDARADQFSFCVALHEGLYGSRPPLAHLQSKPAASPGKPPKPPAGSAPPAWLRGVMTRGLAPAREQRFASMDDLLAAVGRGRTRVRRRASAVAIAMAALLLTAGGWRVTAARRISCVAPKDRLASIWLAGDESSARREAIHRAFTISGRPAAETSWQRVSRALDDYVGEWSAIYVRACEATQVRGEQSGEVLDLRMACLNETLDEVRAFTDVLATGDASTSANAPIAAHDLRELNRCNDITALRSAIPPPRDAETARAVRELRSTINDVNALNEVGAYRAALEKGNAIRARVEATNYKPLLGELLSAIGPIEAEIDPVHGETTLEDAVLAAEASRDDATAAMAGSNLIFAVGLRLARPADGHRWARLANAFLDRTGSPHPRIRSWILHNEGDLYSVENQLDRAQRLLEQALALKQEALGNDHPDVARTLSSMCTNAHDAGHHEESLRFCDRAIAIIAKLDPDSALLANVANNRAEALNALGKPEAAAADFQVALRILRLQFGPDHQYTAHPLLGLGEARLALGDPAGALPFLEESLRIRTEKEAQTALLADSQFAMSRALWGGGDRKRAGALATAAAAAYARSSRPNDQQRALAWLAAHKAGRR